MNMIVVADYLMPTFLNENKLRLEMPFIPYNFFFKKEPFIIYFTKRYHLLYSVAFGQNQQLRLCLFVTTILKTDLKYLPLLIKLFFHFLQVMFTKLSLSISFSNFFYNLFVSHNK